MMAHIDRNCWTDLVQVLHNGPYIHAEERVRSPHEPPRAGFRGSDPPSVPNPRDESWPSPRPASSRFGRGSRAGGLGGRNYGAPMAETTEQTTATGAALLRPRSHAAGRRQRAGHLGGAAGGRAACPTASIPGEDLVFRIFNIVRREPAVDDAHPPGRVAGTGWSRSSGPGGRRARRPRRCVDLVQPYATVLIEEHHAAGRPVVDRHDHPRTTWCSPLADLLGFDAVIATRYGERDGELRRHASTASSCGARASTAPCRSGPTSNGVDLDESYAYSDSYYDVPLLNAVGHPVVGEPRPAHAAAGPGPAVADALPRRAARRAEARRDRAAAGDHPVRAGPSWCPTSTCSTSRAPTTSRLEGPAIICGNHRSYFDPLAIGVRGRQARSAGALPRQEGGLRRADRRRPGPGHGRHPRRAGHRQRRAAEGGGRPRSRPARWW